MHAMHTIAAVNNVQRAFHKAAGKGFAARNFSVSESHGLSCFSLAGMDSSQTLSMLEQILTRRMTGVTQVCIAQQSKTLSPLAHMHTIKFCTTAAVSSF